MDLFAAYDPEASRLERLDASSGLVIRLASFDDVPALAEISQARNGGTLGTHERKFTRDIAPERDTVAIFVAELSGELIGYGRVVLFSAPGDAPANVAPDGWYLMGVVVRPECRRRGVAMRLIAARLDWIGSRADFVYCFASAANEASLAMQRKAGFVEVTRDFWFPTVSFTGGIGVLSRLALPARVAW